MTAKITIDQHHELMLEWDWSLNKEFDPSTVTQGSDQKVAWVCRKDHDLKRGSYDQCHACRMPITEQEKQHQHYQEGLSCHHCFGTLDTEQKQRFAERQKQISLGKQRGEEHIGNAAQEATERRRAEKRAEKEAARNRPPEPEL